ILGLREQRPNRQTGTLVSVYDGEAAGMDTDAGRWQTVCEEHGAICSHSTLALARYFLAAPAEWCEECSYIAEQPRDEEREPDMATPEPMRDVPTTDAERVDVLVSSGKAVDELEAFTMLHALDHPEQSHTEAFAEFRAKRDAERAAEIKVTWRKVSEDTGGGWSGLGPNGALVFVRREASGFAYGDVHKTMTPWRRSVVGYAATLARAKRAAEALFTHDGGEAAREEAQVATETTNPTAESLMAGLGQATSPDKAPYSRLQVKGKTLAYCSNRKDGVLLDFAAGIVEDAPARFQKALEHKGNRATMHVTARNAKGARSLLEWVAKQVG